MLNTSLKVLSLFTPRERLQALGLLLAIMLGGVLQVISIGAVLPFLNVLADQEFVDRNQWLSWLFNTAGFESQQTFVFFLGFLVLVVLVLSNAFKAGTQWAIYRFGWEKQHQLSARLLENYLSQPYVAFLNRNSADLGKNILAEVRQLTEGILIPSMRLLASVVTALAILGFLMWFNALLSLLGGVVLGGAYGLFYLMVRRKLRRIGQVRLQANTQRYKQVNEAFGGIKDVKLMGKERNFVAQYFPASRSFSQANATRQIIGMIPRYALETIAFGGLLLVVLVLLATQGNMGNVLPTAGVFGFAIYRLLPALQEGFNNLSTIRFNQVVVDSIYNDMIGRYGPGVVPVPCSTDSSDRLPLRQAIHLRGVTFTYPNAEQPALRDITLGIRKNTSVAFVGATGAGKTTLVDILLGLLRPQQGSLAVDGTLVDDENLRAWQNLLGYVPQHIYLCDDTVARNIAFGVPEDQIDQAAVERAARIANLHDFIMEGLPQGYKTVVGERGVRLSGGQRQRIGIARALYHDPEVLVLDEATNALDGATEEAVQQAIAQAAAAKTLVVIAHRLTTVEDCDVIYLLDQGRVVASGTYGDLLKTSDGFRAMAQV